VTVSKPRSVQVDALPYRLLQPTARYWYGRRLVDDPHPAEQARGREMIEAAATDFRSLEMVTYPIWWNSSCGSWPTS
jgi:hypothetical protein